MNIQIGQKAEMKKVIAEADLLAFGELSGDRNPIHFDHEYAKTTPFKKVIAPGLYVASFISAVLANHLPGAGSVYLSQELSFKAPVFVGDTVTAQVEVISIRIDKKIIELRTTCRNQNGQIVVEGKALTKLLG